MSRPPEPRPRVVYLLLVCFLAVAVFVAASMYLPPGIDWRTNYRLASLAVLSGKSPYTVDLFFASPWTLFPLLPFALVPENLGRAALFLVGIASFAYTAYRLGAKPLGMAVFLLSPPVLHCLLNSNIEWLPLLGTVLPPQIGLLLVMTKPQTGFAVALFWMVEAWRKGGLRQVLRISWPLLVIFLVSCVFYGFWPMRFRDVLPIAGDINASLWPYTIPVGLALVTAAIRKREIRYAIGASPCLSPYALFHTWSASLVAVSPSTPELIAAVIGLWVLVIFRALAG